ncbi:MAG: hypothetical protein CMJ46_16025 [Planctomyces sp.]|nr:hypothetical protein [Planctomyces sp.]
MGPLHPDPEQMAALRAEYFIKVWDDHWETEEDKADFRADNCEWNARWARHLRELYDAMTIQSPMMIWVTRCWHDQLYLWWMLTTLDSWGDIDWENVWLVDAISHIIGECGSVGDRDVCLPCHSDKALEESFAENRYPIDKEFVTSAKRMWDAFARGALDEVDQLRRIEEIVQPVASVVEYGLGFMLPRQDKSGQYRLSSLDQFFLKDFSKNEWLRPIDTAKDWLKKDDVAPLYLDNTFNGSPYLYRLREWDTYQPDHPLIESKPIPEGPSGYVNIEYRLTDFGDDIIRNGFTDARLVPPYPFGGTTIYDPEALWCTVPEGDGYRVVQV